MFPRRWAVAVLGHLRAYLSDRLPARAPLRCSFLLGTMATTLAMAFTCAVVGPDSRVEADPVIHWVSEAHDWGTLAAVHNATVSGVSLLLWPFSRLKGRQRPGATIAAGWPQPSSG